MVTVVKPKFEDIQVSTKTIIAFTNLEIDIENLFPKLTTKDYVIIPKKRGRKKKDEYVNPNENLEPGSIITLKYQDKVRGSDLKKKKVNKSQKYFRNALTMVMVIEKNKLLNFKISKNGKFQITGCKHDEHAQLCIKYFWDHLKSVGDTVYRINGDNIRSIFITVMTNIDFNIGFYVNREALDHYVNSNTQFNSLLETSFGYTGVNIKIPMKIKENMNINCITLVEDVWIHSKIKYSAYLDIIGDKAREKEKQKKRFNTFLVFQSGNVIMSGMIKEYMEEYYDIFFNIVEKCKHLIKEKISK